MLGGLCKVSDLFVGAFSLEHAKDLRGDRGAPPKKHSTWI